MAVRTLLLVNGIFTVTPSGPEDMRFDMDIKIDYEVNGMQI